jgi:hypothetical protein
MKVEEVLLRATAGKIMWWQAAEMTGISDRQLRRWRRRYEDQGYNGLLDRRRGFPAAGVCRRPRRTRFLLSTASSTSI